MSTNLIVRHEDELLDTHPYDEWGIRTGNIPGLIKEVQTPRYWVVDNFYSDPDSVREYGLMQDYWEGEGSVGLRTRKQFLFDGLKERFEQIMQRKIADHTPDGYGWYDQGINGRFQGCVAGTKMVFHCDAQQWAGIIYLSPDASPHSGTSFFRHRSTNVRHADEVNWEAGEGSIVFNKYNHVDPTPYEKIETVANVYNRLILFDGKLIHSGENYFGHDLASSRFFQIFFFNEEPGQR